MNSPIQTRRHRIVGRCLAPLVLVSLATMACSTTDTADTSTPGTTTAADTTGTTTADSTGTDTVGSTTADSTGTADTTTASGNAPADVDVADADIGDAQPRQLTFNVVEDWNSGFSPDGSRIAFSSDRDGDFEIFVMSIDGSGVVQLTHNDALDWAPQWSPDGTRIAFESDHDGYADTDSGLHYPLDVMVMNADGSGLRPLNQHPAYDSGGFWSPDGARIVFSSDRDGDTEIFIIDVDGSGTGGNLGRAPDTSDHAETGGGAATSAPRSTVDFLGHWPVEESDSCGSFAWYLAPGDSVWISAEGFAPNSVVEFAAEAASLRPPQGELLDAPQLPATETDFEGTFQVMWTIPAAPPADEDSAPRIYAFEGTGVNDDGGTHTVSMLSPVVAYPATVPCAQNDEASTTFGEPVEIAVLDNDIEATANTETRLERTERPHGGTFSADTATGVVTFQPNPGFTGTASAHYFAYDSWGIRTRARIEVEVRVDCSIDGSGTGAVIVGTEGDDVICVPDRRDDDAYDFYSPGRDFDYVVDARGGDDIVFGGDGSDLIYGGEGADTIYGHGGRDTIVGGPGADTIQADEFEDLVYGVDSEDTISDVQGFQVVDAPVAEIYWPGPFTRNDWAAAAVSETIIIDVLANDHDINGDIDPPTLRLRALPWGTAIAVWGSGGGAVISYTAPDHIPDEPPYEAPWIPAQSGLDTFQYEICDARGTCSLGEVFVRIS